MEQVQAQRQPYRQLAGGLRHLSGGGGHHVTQPLGIAPQSSGQAHQQHRRSQRPQRARRVAVVEGGGQRVRQQAHDGAARKTHDPQQRQPCPQTAPRRAEAPLGGGASHHTAQRHRQSRRGQHQQQAVNIIGGVKMRHALSVQQIPQRDLVQSAQQLRHRHSQRQYGRAAHEILPPVGHSASLRMSRRYRAMFSWNRRNASKFSVSFSGRWMYSSGNLGWNTRSMRLRSASTILVEPPAPRERMLCSSSMM